ncbi:tRNA (adenosine(37)-N6)-threonylcarbamoyltransferase complex dimerization subunit type 1 TsaB [Peribacillus saganii]|uniref:tRNA (Adenosine(37)-N6)-threonylcarbamoyltransferase complex dimerization subunit type 1 TsaB n=1 Tax=Peribacillus saganii TaxID=2303992 RepID=A0A372LPM7_9BACI|nr:tRNA (adenosine(37)-N6)-threonylcarbamoyltransferase complex dimerization subunit type 1 TsaB [Peribacillus saganii]RFU69235.1 tRNA (adenosine(37)-N6)-threonylcarbamoyltransferase complex dimerization subunit type 1 TsaB [Peribacillus saganii]
MKALAIDTSTYTLGIAVVDGEKVLGELMTNLTKNHSVRVMPAVETLMKECGVKASQLEKIIVASGPGSYTGVRIGVTIAKTLAWTLNIPLTGVSSLEVLAANGRYFDGLVSPLFDARRGQVYTGLYSFQNGYPVAELDDINILSTDWASKLKEFDRSILFCGNDVNIHRETLINILGDQAFFLPEHLGNPRPSELAFIGLKKEPVDTHSFVPNYIRLAEAESKWLEQQGS